MIRNQKQSKLIKELNKLTQILNKIDAYGVGKDPNTLKNLGDRLHDEIADVEAALALVKQAMQLDGKRIRKRKDSKIKFYTQNLKEPKKKKPRKKGKTTKTK